MIESPTHNESITTLASDHLASILHAYKERVTAIKAMPNISLVMIFRNYGPGAGTSLVHPHSQIIASPIIPPPIIPPHIRDPFQKAALHYDSFGTCVDCDMLAEEERQQDRLVFENDCFLALCPFASRTPFELRIYPKRHMASYFWIQDDEIPAFAEALQWVVTRLKRVLRNPSYNFIIRSAPIGDVDVRYLHWYFVLIPKVTTPAGFEIGSGIYINPTAPENCAAMLRFS